MSTPLEIPQPHEAPPGDALTALAAVVRLGEHRYTPAFALYERASQRARLIARLEDALPGKRLVTVSLLDPRIEVRERSGRFFEILRQIADENAGGRPYDVVLLLDWAPRLRPPALGDARGTTNFTGIFNRGRLVVKDLFPCPFLVFLTRDAMLVLQDKAPDFVSWNSGLYSFPFDAEEVTAGLRAVLEAERPAGAREAAAQVERLEAALADWEELDAGELPDELCPRTLLRLGELFLDDLADSEQAVVYFERLERWADARGEDAGGWAERARRARERAERSSGEEGDEPWKVFRGAAALTDEIFGRETDLDQILELVIGSNFRCGALWGETGSGKSSLLRAGLAPSLRRLGYVPVVVDAYGDLEVGLCREVAAAAGLAEPAETLAATLAEVEKRLALKAKNRKVVLICDQFERFFDQSVSSTRHQREPFLRGVATCVNQASLPFCCLLTVRADRLFRLFELDRRVPLFRPLATENLYELGFLRTVDALRVLERLRDASGAAWSDELIERIVDDLEDDGRVRPVEVQLVAAGIYLRRLQAVAEYEAAGGCEGVLKDYLDAVLDDLDQPELARRVVRGLVLSASPPIRDTRTAEEIAAQLRGKRGAVAGVLEELAIRNLVQVTDEGPPRTWELVHDVLCEPCWRATSPNEIGLSVLRSAIRRRRRWLRMKEWVRALRSDVDELPERQRSAARKVLRSTAFVVALKALGLAVLLLTAVQFSTAHVWIESEPPQAARVYRGLSALRSLPAPWGQTVLFDTGLVDEQVPSNLRNQLQGMTFLAWDGARSERVEQAHTYLDRLVSVRRLCSLGYWDEGVRLLLENRYGEADVLLRIFEDVRSDEVLSQILSLLHDDDSELRAAAAGALGRIGTEHSAKLVPELLPLLQDDDYDVRRATAAALGQIGTEHSVTLVPKLLPLLQDDDYDVRRATAAALGQIGAEHSVTLVPKLLPLVQDDDYDVRRAAVAALGQIGAEHSVTLGSELLLDTHDIQRMMVLALLGQIGAEHSETLVLQVLPLLQNDDDVVRQAAVKVLGQIGAEQAATLVPQLLPLLQDDHSNVREATVRALVGIGAGQTATLVPQLLPLLQDDHANVRKATVRALVGIGAEQSLVAQLIPLLQDLQDDHAGVHKATVRGLVGIDAERVEALVPQLLPLLQDDHADVREATALALGQIAAKQAEMVVHELLPLLQDDDSSVRYTTVKALGQIAAKQATTDDTVPVYQALITELGHRESEINSQYRNAVVHALALWYNAGLPPEDGSDPKSPPEWTQRATAEHQAFHAELDRLIDLNRPWWLRVAAWDVLIEAERLR